MDDAAAISAAGSAARCMSVLPPQFEKRAKAMQHASVSAFQFDRKMRFRACPDILK